MGFFSRNPPRFPLRSLSAYRTLARKRLPKQIFDYIDGGATEEITKNRNKSDYQKIHFRKRVMKDISLIETETEILGQKMAMPLILGPVGFSGVFAKRGEIQAAKAAEAAHIPFTLSTMAICSIEEVREAVAKSFWYQFYFMKDKSYSLELLKRAQMARCPVLLVTVDLPIIGMNSRYHRNNMRIFHSLFHLNWFIDVRLRGGPLTLGNAPKAAKHLKDISSMREWVGREISLSTTWKDLDWLRENWPGKIVLKGVLDLEDARIAASSGVDGIIISNHGGRHFDGTSSTISLLPKMAETIRGKITLLIDGGISSGSDVVKALALGANGCLIGRAWAFALAARGETGVREILSLFHQEIKVIMANLGCTSIKDVNYLNVF